MPKTQVDKHPQRKAIIHDLLDQAKSLRDMQAEYGIGYKTLHYYRAQFLAKRVVAARQSEERGARAAADEHERRDIRDADFILDEVEGMITKVRKMLDSADEALQDPDRPDRYFLGPQSTDVEVVYGQKDEDGIVVKKKALLQELIDGVENDGKMVLKSKVWLMDPRKILLSAADSLGSKLEILIKFAEELRKQRSEDIRSNPQYLRLQNAFAKAIRKYPALVGEFERELADGD